MQIARIGRSSRPSTFRVLTGVILALLLITALLAESATAVPSVSCGYIKVGSTRYLVTAHVLSCTSAKSWAANYIAHGTIPHGYKCQKFPPGLTRVRFTCYNPLTATRSDGPQSFTASV